jgi:hypothetical protein
MDRRAHQLRPHRATLGDQAAELLRIEVAQPRRQRDVRVRGDLRLHPDEPLDHRGGGEA